MAVKLDPKQVPDLPAPRPAFEIWVYSPGVEGVHLRFGPVARGGLRWSDRREDFRTEVLGLMKAQMVKNALIVPVGAKGGAARHWYTVPDGLFHEDARVAITIPGVDAAPGRPRARLRSTGRTIDLALAGAYERRDDLST